MLIINKVLKVAVLGSNSFLANAFIEKHIEKHSLFLFGKKKHHKSLFKNFREFYFPEKDLYYPDLLEFDVIVNFVSSGVNHKDKKINNEIANVNFPIKLIEFLNENKYKGHLITFGSHFEIGSVSFKKHFTEKEIIERVNEIYNKYSISKNLLTQYINSSPSIFLHTHLILPQMFGPEEASNRLIPYLIRKKKENEKIYLSSPSKIRQFLHVFDLAELLLKIVENKKIGIYNVKSIETFTIQEIASLIFNKEEIIYGKEMRDDDMKILLLDTKKIDAAIDWKPKLKLSDYLKNISI